MNQYKIYRIKTWRMLSIFLTVLFTTSCQDYLDVVPDNVSTLEHAFKLRNEAEKYLFTCYSYIPRNGTSNYNIAMHAGDEVWLPFEKGFISYAFYIARGNQRTSGTYCNVWDGYYQGAATGPLYDGIRHCNTFMEILNTPGTVPDLEDYERERWIAEAQFLKAYYHFILLKMYGPIPIIDVNLPIDATQEQVNVRRMPVDSCFNYVARELKESANKLPELITDRTTELGRITKPIALAIRAKVLLTAASPLFNGNTDYGKFLDHNGQPFFNQTYDATKWQKAAVAAKEAIDIAEENGHALYYFTNKTFALSDTTVTQMSIRQAVCERWNSEIIWGNPNSITTSLQLNCMVPLAVGEDHNFVRKIMSPPVKIAKMFYSKNGVPIEEDKTLDFSNPSAIRSAVPAEKFNIKPGYKTARLNFDREPRFYADMSFDGGIWYKYDSPSNSDVNTYHVEAKLGDYAGSSHAFHFNVTGYYIKKLVDWTMTLSTSGASYKGYPWPEIRLADLYLMYAEAKNEASGPDVEIYEYLNLIRKRAGLQSVQESWFNYSVYPSKYTTQEGLREIIQRERLIELAFEGKRYWDLRRWKLASEYLNEPITGWNVRGADEESYYQILTLYQQEFVAPRDYLWPLEENELLINPNLVQNPGW